MEKEERDTETKVAEGSKVANPEPSSPSLQKDISTSEHSIGIQPTTKDALSPRSPTPTMKTDSVDTDSASISASTSPALSSSNPSPPPHQAAILNPQLQVALKLLVSNSASGYIIGRSGKTVSDLQTKSLARIKLSQGGDYYPGTTDRVCLIQGMLSNVSVALQMILIKLHEVHSHQRVPTPTKAKTSPVESSTSVPGDETTSTPSFVVKILIPSSCCGMMIGLGGSNIKALKDKSAGVTHIQLSRKDDEVRAIGGGMSTLPTSERIMTIAGSSYTSCLTCIQHILNDMAINPEIARYLNMTTSYSRNIVTTSPIKTMVPSAYVAAPAAASGIHSPYQYPPVAHRPGQFQPLSPPRSAQNMSLLSQELMHHQGDVSALSDPSSQSSQPSQGMMPATPPRVSDLNQNPSSFPQYQSGPQTQYWSPSSRRMSSSSGHNISPVVDQLSHNFQAQASIQRYASSSSLQEMTPQQLVTVQLGVADTRIGSILGHGGKKLTEIQALSRTKIRISQRGDFIPNTQNRIVTITGSTAQDVEHAQQLIIKRLAGGDLRASLS